MNKRLGNSRFRLELALSLVAGVTVAPVDALGQDSLTIDVPRSVLRRYVGLTPAGPSQSVVFQNVDAIAGENITVQIVTSVSNLTATIDEPGGGQINAANIAGTYSGTYSAQEAPTGSSPPGILIGIGPGFNQVFSFPSTDPGNYTLNLSLTPAPTADVVVTVDLRTQSPVAVQFSATETDVTVDDLVAVSAFVFEGTSAVAGATATATVMPPTLPEFRVILLDNGIDADAVEGDGIYSALFTPTETGEYAAKAEITGTRTSGAAFFREFVTVVDVAPLFGQVDGAAFVDFGQDSNANSLYDWLVIEAQNVDFAQAGTYGMHVVLETQTGPPQRCVVSDRSSLPLLGRGQSRRRSPRSRYGALM